MNSLKLFLLLLTLCSILISQFALPTNARAYGHHELIQDGSNLIGQICKEIVHRDNECMDLVSKIPKIFLAKDFLEVSDLVLEFALRETIEGQKFLKGLLKTKYVAAISDCADSYDRPVFSFTNALSELKDKPLIANYDANIAGDGPTDCEYVLANAHIINPQISKLDHKIVFLSTIAAYATGKLIS